jgi:hypothetical protein
MACCNNKNEGVMDSLFIKCDCLACSFELSRVEETYDKGPPIKMFELSVWQLIDTNRPFGWRERIRWAWRIISTGMPWADMIIISDEKAKKVAQFITKHTS